MATKQLFALFALVLAAGLLGSACLGDDDTDKATATTTIGSDAPTATAASTTATKPAASPTTGSTPLAGDAAAGQTLSQSKGCAGCHSIDGSQMTGPTWQGLYGSQVQLDSANTVTADDAYLAESILNPTAKIVSGFPPVMPSFQGQLSDQDVADLIAYIKTLK